MVANKSGNLKVLRSGSSEQIYEAFKASVIKSQGAEADPAANQKHVYKEAMSAMLSLKTQVKEGSKDPSIMQSLKDLGYSNSGVGGRPFAVIVGLIAQHDPDAIFVLTEIKSAVDSSKQLVGNSGDARIQVIDTALASLQNKDPSVQVNSEKNQDVPPPVSDRPRPTGARPAVADAPPPVSDRPRPTGAKPAVAVPSASKPQPKSMWEGYKSFVANYPVASAIASVLVFPVYLAANHYNNKGSSDDLPQLASVAPTNGFERASARANQHVNNVPPEDRPPARARPRVRIPAPPSSSNAHLGTQPNAAYNHLRDGDPMKAEYATSSPLERTGISPFGEKSNAAYNHLGDGDAMGATYATPAAFSALDHPGISPFGEKSNAAYSHLRDGGAMEATYAAPSAVASAADGVQAYVAPSLDILPASNPSAVSSSPYEVPTITPVVPSASFAGAPIDSAPDDGAPTGNNPFVRNPVAPALPQREYDEKAVQDEVVSTNDANQNLTGRMSPTNG